MGRSVPRETGRRSIGEGASQPRAALRDGVPRGTVRTVAVSCHQAVRPGARLVRGARRDGGAGPRGPVGLISQEHEHASARDCTNRRPRLQPLGRGKHRPGRRRLERTRRQASARSGRSSAGQSQLPERRGQERPPPAAGLGQGQRRRRGGAGQTGWRVALRPTPRPPGGPPAGPGGPGQSESGNCSSMMAAGVRAPVRLMRAFQVWSRSANRSRPATSVGPSSRGRTARPSARSVRLARVDPGCSRHRPPILARRVASRYSPGRHV